MQILDRIFDSHHVIVLWFINDVDDGRQGWALARSGGSRNQDQAIAQVSNLSKLWGKDKWTKRGDVGGDNPHYDGINAALLKNVDAKTGAGR